MKTNIPSLILVSLLTGFASLQPAQALVPSPDGGYPGANTAEGQNALFSLSTGSFNTGVGWSSLKSDMTGSYNTALGAGALVLNTADGNTATGAGALLGNTTGGFNTANGVLALFHNTEGEFNTAFGSFVLANNTTGARNMAMGDSALLNNTTGFENVAIGVSALRNSNASENVAIGKDAMVNNNTGNFNVGIGSAALRNNTSADGNTAIGNDAGVNITGTSNICIGSEVTGVVGENNTIRIGDNLPNNSSACYIGGIYGALVAPPVGAVVVGSDGHLGTSLSSKRFKQDIEPMNKASEAIYSLRPVSFHYKGDDTKTPCFGLIAEDVAKVNPDLILLDKEGKPLTVRYEQINAMLLNEFLKEHARVEQLKKDFESKIAEQQKEIEGLTAGLQKVSAQLEVNKSAPQTVLNNH